MRKSREEVERDFRIIAEGLQNAVEKSGGKRMPPEELEKKIQEVVDLRMTPLAKPKEEE